MVYKFYFSLSVVVMILSIVIQVFENFCYYCDFVVVEGLDVVFEFSVEVNGKELKGIDMICFDENGKIVEFEVMIWFMSGLQVLGEEMGWRVGYYLKIVLV